jgi:hypothetical protein
MKTDLRNTHKSPHFLPRAQFPQPSRADADRALVSMLQTNASQEAREWPLQVLQRNKREAEGLVYV